MALPTGEWAMAFPGSHLESHIGRIERPTGHAGPFDILYLDITNAGGFRIAGQAQQEPQSPDRGAWMWENGRWTHVSTEAPGTYPVMFDAQGRLHIATTAQNGSQGWRYIAEDGELVSGDDTLNAQRRIGVALGLSNLWEYTHLGGVVIGQGETGCDVIAGGARRRLENGDTHFIRVRHAGDTWAVAMTKLAEDEAVIGFFTRADLEALPLVEQSVVPDPAPAPEPDPPVTPPKPEPVPMPDFHVPEALDNQSALVTEVRNTLFPNLVGKPLNDPAKAMLMTKTVAWRLRQHGVGLVKAKPGSENNVDGFTSDIVALKNGVHWDIQQDGHTGAAFAQWSMEPNPENYPPIAARWTPPVDPGGNMPEPVALLPHAYDGGDNDTGTCDVAGCGQPRSAAIHVTAPPVDDNRELLKQLVAKVDRLQATLDRLSAHFEITN